MKNVSMKMNGSSLIIAVDLSKDFGVSSSGKNLVIATTEGNVGIPSNTEIKIGLNIYSASKVTGAIVANTKANSAKNVAFAIKATTAIITVDLSEELGLSGSGKSMMIATTAGNIALNNSGEIKMGLNIYKKV